MSVIKYRDSDGKMKPIPTIKGEDGKSAYQYAVDGGYTGTEEEFAQKMGQQVVPDWNENNPDSPSYIKNRFGGYTIGENKTLIYSKTVTPIEDNGYVFYVDTGIETELIPDDDYIIVFDGVEYRETCRFHSSQQNFRTLGYHTPATSPIALTVYEYDTTRWTVSFLDKTNQTEHTIEIYHIQSSTATRHVQIPERYLPFGDTSYIKNICSAKYSSLSYNMGTTTYNDKEYYICKDYNQLKDGETYYVSFYGRKKSSNFNGYAADYQNDEKIICADNVLTNGCYYVRNSSADAYYVEILVPTEYEYFELSVVQKTGKLRQIDSKYLDGFPIQFVFNNNEYSNSQHLDKTFSEIMEAIRSGKRCYVVFPSYDTSQILNLVTYDVRMIAFTDSRLSVILFKDNSLNVQQSILQDSDEEDLLKEVFG